MAAFRTGRHLTGRRRWIALVVVATAALGALVAIREARATISPAGPLSENGWVTGASAPATAAAGTTVSILIGARAATGQSAVLDVELYTPTAQVAQAYWPDQQFVAGAVRQYNVKWNIPAGQAPGTVTVKIGVFASGWYGLLHWNDQATTFSVVAAGGGTPSTTAAPATTKAPTTTVADPTVPTITATPTTTTVRPTTTSTTSTPTTVTTSGPTVPSNNPTACGLAAPAFCETFDAAKPVAGTRSGDLDPTLWGVSRTISTDDFLSDWLAPTGFTEQMSTPVAGCSFGSQPGGDVKICNGRLLEASRNPENTKTNLSIYPKQPMDFSSGADIAFDASMDGRSIHSAWPEIWVTDQPVPASNGDEEGYQSSARNAIGFKFTGCFGDGNRESFSVASVETTAGYRTTTIPFSTDGCVQTAAHATVSAALNHVRISLTPTSFTIFGRNPGSAQDIQLAHGSWNSTLPNNRGLVWWSDVHYNSCKFDDDLQCDHAFAIDNFGFSGPKTYRDYTYDVADAGTASTTIDPVSGAVVPAVALAYPVGDGLKVSTVAVGSVPRTPTAVGVLFNVIGYDSANVPDVRLNGGEWISTAPFTQANNYIHSVDVVIPAGNYVSGPNTIEFRSPGNVISVANVNLLLVNAAPVP